MKNETDREYVYWFKKLGEDKVKMGHGWPPERLRSANTPDTDWEWIAAIVGGEPIERQCQSYFQSYCIEREVYRYEGNLRTYLDWLNTRAFAALAANELEQTYPAPNRFPWSSDYSKGSLVEGQRELFDVPGMSRPDHISPRSPRGMNERILRTLRSDSDDYVTPPAYTHAARQVMGSIDLDPASTSIANKTVGAKEFYTIDDNGLKYKWFGRVWLNPPYLKTDPWIKYALDQIKNGNVRELIVCLNSHGTDTAWFQEIWPYQSAKTFSALCFTDHRVQFHGGRKRDVNFEGKDPDETNPTKGTVFAYYGEHVESFIEVFRQFGPVVISVARKLSMDKNWAKEAWSMEYMPI